MSNLKRGNLDIKIGEKEYLLRMEMDTIEEIETHFDLSIYEIAQKFDDKIIPATESSEAKRIPAFISVKKSMVFRILHYCIKGGMRGMQPPTFLELSDGVSLKEYVEIFASVFKAINIGIATDDEADVVEKIEDSEKK